MGTVSDKLVYLNGTKTALKDSINLMGVNITDDTFRSYADKVKDGLLDIINNGTNTVYNNWEKVTATDVAEATLQNTVEAPMKIDVKGNTEQDGTPTPTNPIDVEVVTGNNTIQVTGKNKISLLNAVRTINTSVTPTNIEANSFNMSGKNAWSNKSFLYNNVKVNTDYTISSVFQSSISSTVRISVYGTNVEQYTSSDLIKLADSDSVILDSDIPSSLVCNFNSGEYQYILIRFWNNSTSTVLSESTDMLVNNIQLEEGSTATEFNPYQHAEYSLNLGDIELCKIGNYKDYPYPENGKWYVHKEIEKGIIDENVNLGYSQQTNNVFYNTSYLVNKPNATSNNIPFCNLYKGENNVSVASRASEKGNNTIMFKTQDTAIYIVDNRFTTVSSFKQWIADNNIIFYYRLKTPTNIEITDTTLIEQLEAIYNAKSKTGTTYITQTNADLPFILDITALKDI